MTTRPADPRRNARRGATDASEAGYALAVEHDQPAVNRFQYPLVDRVGFEGWPTASQNAPANSFSILWWIELVLRAWPSCTFSGYANVSVSSGGSSWF